MNSETKDLAVVGVDVSCSTLNRIMHELKIVQLKTNTLIHELPFSETTIVDLWEDFDAEMDSAFQTVDSAMLRCAGLLGAIDGIPEE